MPEDRKIHKCSVCGHYFNATTEIMVDHYLTYHEPAYNKVMTILTNAIKLNHFRMLINTAPFPLNIRYMGAMALLEIQQHQVIAEPIKIAPQK